MSKNHPLIQVAGVHDKEEAQILVDCGVTHIGFPFRLPVNREDLSELEASSIIKKLGNSVKTVLITYLNQAEEVLDLASFLGVDMVQLHGEIEATEIEKIGGKSELEIIKSLIVGRYDLLTLCSQVDRFSPYVDYFITDTFDPKTGAEGATGKVHDWEISRQLVEYSSRPIILAGGINPTNTEAAIHTVLPAGVDTHTGVEDNKGRKSYDLVKQFVTNSQKAFENLPAS